MSINQFIFLKMGKKILFKENLLTLKNSDIRAPQSCPPGIKIRKLELDIIPKFIANENMQELNKELMDRLLKKKNIFIKMMKSYFSQNEGSFTNSIQEVENEMNRCKDIMENNKRAALYIRVSTDDQTEYSPDSQIKLCRKYSN